MAMEPRLSRLVLAGDSALMVEFASATHGWGGPEDIDQTTNQHVVALAHAIGQAAPPGVRDVVPAFTSLAVHFDPLRTDAGQLVALVEQLARTAVDAPAIESECVAVPVCYGGEYGPDLSGVAALTDLDGEQVVALHCARIYRVFTIGFSPGFPYLGVVDERLRVPRRASPRTRVVAGSVGLAGPQTGIYPVESPGGWHIIGRTPLRIFDVARARPCRFRPGMLVRFHAVTALEYADLVSRPA